MTKSNRLYNIEFFCVRHFAVFLMLLYFFADDLLPPSPGTGSKTLEVVLDLCLLAPCNVMFVLLLT